MMMPGNTRSVRGTIKITAGFFRERYYLLTAPLMFLSFPSYDLAVMKFFPFFAWFSLVPLFISLRRKSMKDVYWTSFITGLLGNLFTFNWIGNFGISVPGGPAVILLFLVPTLTVYFSIKIFIAEYLSRRCESLRFLIYPSAWIIGDWLASVGFLAFPMTFWGYSQYPFSSFIQLASVTGIMGVTFVLVLSNSLLADVVSHHQGMRISLKGMALSKPGRLFFSFIVFVAIVTISGAVVLYRNTGGTNRDLRVSVVQSCINPWVDWSDNKYRYLEELKNLTERSLTENPDFIIWSESATLETITYNYYRGVLNPFEQDLVDSVIRWRKPLLTGEVGVAERRVEWGVARFPLNNAVLLDAHGMPLLTYSKIFLVPFGEWFPYERIAPFLRPLLDSFGASQFIPGSIPLIFNLNGFNFGTLICYEGIFHRLCRTYKNMGAQFFINITNDGWTHAYSGHMQHFASSIFRSVENGIWYIRVGNTGYTAFVDPYGRVVRSLPIWEKRYLIGDLDFSLNHWTVYQAAGDVILYLAGLFLLVVSCINICSRIRKRHEKA